MASNFRLVENYAIDFEGRHINLNNNFNFIKLERIASENNVSLSWIKSKGDWVSKDELKQVNLLVKNVNK